MCIYIYTHTHYLNVNQILFQYTYIEEGSLFNYLNIYIYIYIYIYIKVQGLFIRHIIQGIIRSEMQIKSGPLSGQCKKRKVQ